MEERHLCGEHWVRNCSKTKKDIYICVYLRPLQIGFQKWAIDVFMFCRFVNRRRRKRVASFSKKKSKNIVYFPNVPNWIEIIDNNKENPTFSQHEINRLSMFSSALAELHSRLSVPPSRSLAVSALFVFTESKHYVYLHGFARKLCAQKHVVFLYSRFLFWVNCVFGSGEHSCMLQMLRRLALSARAMAWCVCWNFSEQLNTARSVFHRQSNEWYDVNESQPERKTYTINFVCFWFPKNHFSFRFAREKKQICAFYLFSIRALVFVYLNVNLPCIRWCLLSGLTLIGFLSWTRNIFISPFQSTAESWCLRKEQRCWWCKQDSWCSSSDDYNSPELIIILSFFSPFASSPDRLDRLMRYW